MTDLNSLVIAYSAISKSSPVVANHGRSNKMWIKYTSLSPLDLEVLLRAARELVQQVRVKG